MDKHVKNALLFSLLILALAAPALIWYARVLYLTDCVRSLYIESVERLMPRGKTAVPAVSPKGKRLVPTYHSLPRDYMHCGGTLFYKAGEDEDADRLARTVIGLTDYLRSSALRSDLCRVNGIRENEIPAGEIVIIPGSLPSFIEDMRKTRKPVLIKCNGLYFSGTSAGSKKFAEKLPLYKSLGVNTVVFDAKDVTGILNYYSRVKTAREYNTHKQRTIDNIAKFIREVKSNGMYCVARIAVFQDRLLAKADKTLAIRSRNTGDVWHGGKKKEVWCDPTNRRVQDYNIGLAVELARLGVDEIQFDYIRFPTEGSLKDCAYRFDFGGMSKVETITHFLKRAHQALAAENTNLSIDIFGVVAWEKEVDIRSTGQKIEELAKHCDVLSPMLYPSHFSNDFDGYSRPANNPYYFIYNGCLKIKKLVGNGTQIRPWLQAFKWRVSQYNEDYITVQMKASDDAGAVGYLFWNASNDYRVVLSALEELRDRKGARKAK